MSENRTVLPMTLLVPWDPRFELGVGYDYMTQTPLIPVVPTPEPVHSPVAASHLEYKYVTDQADLNQLIAASVEGAGSLQGIEVKASLAFTKSVRFSETSQTLVFSWYSDCTHFDRIKAPALDESAMRMSETDPDDFRLRYGDYFVSGGLQRAEFHAVYQMSALKKEDLLSFKASAAVSKPDLFSAEGSAAFAKAASENHVSISATVYQSASKSSPSMGSTPGLTPVQVLEMFKQFQTDHQDSWAVAELTHYSALTSHLSRAVPVPPNFAVDRALLLGARVAYRGLLDAGLIPRDAAASLRSRQAALDAKVNASLYWDDPGALTADREAAEALAHDVREATEFLHRVHVLAGSDGGRSNVIGRRGGEAGIGVHGDQTSVPAGIKVSVDTFSLTGDWEFGTQITRFADRKYAGCTIVYLQAHNNWPADTGGSLQRFSGGIGSDHVHFGCESDLTRGLSWSFTVKYVESE